MLMKNSVSVVFSSYDQKYLLQAKELGYWDNAKPAKKTELGQTIMVQTGKKYLKHKFENQAVLLGEVVKIEEVMNQSTDDGKHYNYRYHLSNPRMIKRSDVENISEVGRMYAGGFLYVENTIKDISFVTEPDELSLEGGIFEGASKRISVNAYERNPLARKKCVEKFGYDCSVCGFNFFDVYGEIGLDFIHVHHLYDISLVNKEYEVDPYNHLRPVCPNCHAMLHREKPALSIETLKNKLKKYPCEF